MFNLIVFGFGFGFGFGFILRIFIVWYFKNKKENRVLHLKKNKITAYLVATPHIITIKTTGLINRVSPVVNADYACYTSSSQKIFIKKIYNYQTKQMVKEVECRLGYGMVNVITGQTYSNYLGTLFKSLKSVKNRINNPIQSDGWKKQYDDRGRLCSNTLYRHGDSYISPIIKKFSFFDNRDFVIEHNFLHNYTCIRNGNKEILDKITGIVHFICSTTLLENKKNIRSVTNYHNRRYNGFQKIFWNNGNLMSIECYKNNKLNGKVFDLDGFRFVKNHVVIFTNLIYLFKNASFYINKKQIIKVV
jgi:antitoxin component YwqK of YwqJK toxin-antitoxin module